MAAECKGHRVEHLHALRHQVVESDVIGKTAEAQVFVGQSEVVGDTVGDAFRGQRVDQVPDAVGAENDPSGQWNANGIARARAAPAPAPRRHHRGDPDAEENAPVREVQEQQEEDEDALGGGADTERDLRWRRVLAHRQDTESVGGGQREGGAEEGGEKRHRVAPPL